MIHHHQGDWTPGRRGREDRSLPSFVQRGLVNNRVLPNRAPGKDIVLGSENLA